MHLQTDLHSPLSFPSRNQFGSLHDYVSDSLIIKMRIFCSKQIIS